MSALPGKVSVEGITEINGEKVFVLTMLQAREPKWAKRPFFAKYDNEATWMSDLRPAFGKDKFFYQDELNQMIRESQGQSNIHSNDDLEIYANTELNADD